MSKQCEIVGDLLPLYVDGVCSEASGDLVREHLDTCPGCRTLYEQMRTRGGEEFIKREKDGVVRRHERKESRRILRYLFLSAALLYLPTLLLVSLFSEPDGTFIAMDRWFVLLVLFVFTVPFYLAFLEFGRLLWGAVEKRKRRLGERILDWIGGGLALAIGAVGIIATALDRDDWIGLVLGLGGVLLLNWIVSAIVYRKRLHLKTVFGDKTFWICLAVMAAVVALAIALPAILGGSKGRPDPMEPIQDDVICVAVYDT